MASKMFLYFGYGSNLLRERLLLANPSAVFVTVARLQGYRLVFCGDAVGWKGGVASIKKSQNSQVWGVVWKLDLADMASLDRQESNYTAFEVEVTCEKGDNYRCRTYQLSYDWEESSPSPHYKDVILRGARQHQLPQHYLQFLQDIPDNGYQGIVALYDSVMNVVNTKQQLDCKERV